MATDLSATSRFSLVSFGWGGYNHVSSIAFQTTTDASLSRIYLNYPRHYEDVAEDSDLALLRDNYAANDGLLDTDGNKLTLEIRTNLADDPVPIEALSFYGSFNPFIAAEFEGWLENLEVRGAFIREGQFSRDGVTERPRISTPFDDIPIHRNPGTTTFDKSLADWEVSQVLNDIRFTRSYSEDEAITDPNSEDSVLAFLVWVESLRQTGDAIGTDITATIATFGSRTFQLNQGDDAETLDLELAGGSHDQRADNTYSHVSVSFRRVTAETDDIDVEAIRTLLLTETASIPAEDDQEAPERGATDIDHRVREIVFPDDYRLGMRGKQLVLKHPSMGVFPTDGAHVRAIRFASLDDISGVTNGKYMPNDGEAVIHFGHTETAHGILRYRDLGDMLSSDGADLVQRVHNISEDYRCTIQDMDEDTLMILQPYQQSGPLQAALEKGGNGGEILAINPPDRRVVLARGHSAPTFAAGTSYPFLNNGVDDHYHSLRVQPNALEYVDTDAWTIGTDADPASAYLNTITPSDLTIRGEYQILRPGWVNIALRYRLVIDDPAPTGELARGNGASLWISEGGLATFIRDHTAVAEAFGGTGAKLEYHLRYHAKHSANTRFLILHYIPASSNIPTADYDHINQESLEGALILLSPEIRKAVSA